MSKKNLETKCLWKGIVSCSEGKPHEDFNKCKVCDGYEKFCQDYNPIKNYKSENDKKN